MLPLVNASANDTAQLMTRLLAREQGADGAQVVCLPGATLDRLEGEGRVALRYAEPVNGSARNIAGVLNAAGNVLGAILVLQELMETRGPIAA